jgi:uncharacterized protein (TIGR02453 family)
MVRTKMAASAPATAFEGFPAATFEFLKGITEHNDKVWFEAHRAEYELGYVQAAAQFVDAAGPALKKVSKTVEYEAKVNGSLMRIHRDVRFSKDKTPYKTHLDAWFWDGEERGWDKPGFYFRLTADSLYLGAGMHHFEKDLLDRYRAAVLDPKKGKALEKAIADVKAAGPYKMGAPTRKTVPRGFDAEHPRAALLLHEGLYADWEGKIPREARTAKFVDFCVAHFRGVAPISKWLVGALAG